VFVRCAPCAAPN